jgi:two-component system, sensor histidine kinase and response regulator
MNQGPQPAVLFDRSAALDRIGGDEELLQEIANLFLEEYPNLIHEIRAAVLSRDADALERGAHSLKGSVANFEAHAAVEVSLRLESMGRSGNLEQAKAALVELEAVFEALDPALRNLSAR